MYNLCRYAQFLQGQSHIVNTLRFKKTLFLHAVRLCTCVCISHNHVKYCFCTGYSFLVANYNLLYQCIIPSCRLTIATLRQHSDLSDEVEQHILAGSCARIRCQRLLNFLLDVLNADKDYMKFCYLLFLCTTLTDLPCQMMSSKNYYN